MTNPIPPTIGRIVLVNAANLNGDTPAIVTHVHSDECINAVVFPDGGVPYALSSILYLDEAQARGMSMSFHWMDYQLKVAAERDPVSGEATA